jgi:2-iminobutanoate/2-iminopropanoate deaminase
MEISSTRNRISSEPDWYEPYAISLGIRVGDLVFVSGQAAVDEHGRTVGVDDFDAQARQVFTNLATVLGNAGTGLEHVVKVTIFVTDMAVTWQIEIEAIAVVPEATMPSR